MGLSPIIEVAELQRIYKDPEVMIFDASNSKNAEANYLIEHLEGAFFVDLNSQLADIKNDLSMGGRHPLPTLENFARTLSDLGISTETHVIIYDEKNGSNAAARFWWMLRSVGHDKVQVVNGGFESAKRNGFPLSSKMGVSRRISEPYPLDRWKFSLADIDEVERVSQLRDHLVVDVRDKDRYDGKLEPIDLIAGHIPGAINIPFTSNLNENGLFRSPEELRILYKNQFDKIAPENIIVHCGSGVTACHTLLALSYAEMGIPKLYVGSWSEWSRRGKEIERM